MRMILIYAISLFLQTFLVSSTEIISKKDFVCQHNEFYNIYFDTTSKKILITCNNGEFIAADSNFNNCESYKIQNEIETISDVINFKDKYFFSSRNTLNPLNSKHYSSIDLKSFKSFDIANQLPLHFYIFKDELYSLLLNPMGNDILKFNGLEFADYAMESPLLFFNVININNEILLGVGGSTALGGYLFKSNEGKIWEQIILDKDYKLLRNAKIIRNKIFVTSEDGDILKFSIDFKLEETYKLEENERIYDIIEGANKNGLFILTYQKNKKIGKVKYLTYDNQIETIETFTEEFGIKFLNINDKVFFITNLGIIFQVDGTTSVIKQSQDFSSKKMLISRANLINLLNEKKQIQLFNFIGQKVNIETIKDLNYLIQIEENRIIIYNSY